MGEPSVVMDCVVLESGWLPPVLVSASLAQGDPSEPRGEQGCHMMEHVCMQSP